MLAFFIDFYSPKDIIKKIGNLTLLSRGPVYLFRSRKHTFPD